MKILWFINVPLPEASTLLNEEPVPFGGWLINSASILARTKNITLEIAFPKGNIDRVEKIKGEHIHYYAFPIVNYKSIEIDDENRSLQKIIKESKPELVHIYGTEMVHTLSVINICKKNNIKTIISIQGLLSFIAKHYFNGLPERIQHKLTLRDLVKRDSIKMQQKKLVKRGIFEVDAIQKVNDVIGRTTWDKACTSIIHPGINYHYCNETLREEFYRHTWNYENCEKYSIFVSQGSYPIKGLHLMLEALPSILQKFPQAKLYIAGPDITKSSTFYQKLSMTSYGKYIKQILQTNNLIEKVIFTGVLNEKEICQRYLKANVFVCPSTIENSPNSLGEALILGVPSVASDVGGVSDLITHKEEGYVYQSDAPYMLGHYVCEIFENTQRTLRLSEKAKIKGEILYDQEKNNMRLLAIYNQVVCNEENLIAL
jgi:glycosyltransferase involved in cell wall biosynthesis